MRIAYVLKKFPRLSETFILNELLGLEALGHEVEVLSLRPPDDEPRHRDLARLRAQVHIIPRKTSRSFEEDSSSIEGIFLQLPLRNRSKTWAQGLEVASLCQSLGIDHVHAHFMTIASHVAAISRLHGGPPFTVTAHAKDIFRFGINEELFRRVAQLSDGLVTVSQFNRRFIRRRFFSDEPDFPIEMVYNGLPLKDLPPPPSAESRDRGLILAVGRLVEKKGFDLLVEAAAMLAGLETPFRIVIAGGGEQEGELRSMIVAQGLQEHIELLGPIPREEVIRLMGEARMLILPCREGSDGNRDALPTVLIEALACGLPAISTNMVGIPEIIIDEEHGLLIEPEDTGALAQAVHRLLVDDTLWQRCSAAGPLRARSLFDRGHTLPKLARIFEKRGERSPCTASPA